MTDMSVVLVSEWWVNTPITELGDIARHSAINQNFNFFYFFIYFIYFFGVLCINRTPDFEFFSAAKRSGLYTVNYGKCCCSQEQMTQNSLEG